LPSPPTGAAPLRPAAPAHAQAMEVCSRLEGAFALLIKSARYPNELVACKKGSPLVYGVKRGAAPGAAQVWLSSDSAALLAHTRDIVVS
jgi:glucosamine 6-phosphate synthetase-like amidotransferase/phosphosugar isomerase protein